MEEGEGQRVGQNPMGQPGAHGELSPIALWG